MNNVVFLALALTLGTRAGATVGAGIVVDGGLHRGVHNAGGEIGDPIMSRSSLGKDRRGHSNLERLIGRRGIRRTAARLTGEKLGTGEALARGESDARLSPLTANVADHIAMSVIDQILDRVRRDATTVTSFFSNLHEQPGHHRPVLRG